MSIVTIGHRYVTQYFHLKGISASIIKVELDSPPWDSVPSLTTINYWVTEFKQGRSNCQDEHRTERAIEVSTLETIKKIDKIHDDDHRLW